MLVWEFNQHIEAYKKNEQDEWHKVRVLGTFILRPHLKKGSRLKPSDLIPLPDDVKQVRSMDDRRAESDIERKLNMFKRVRGIT